MNAQDIVNMTYSKGLSDGVAEERNRILEIIMHDDWNGESLEEDRRNLVYRITRHLIEEI